MTVARTEGGRVPGRTGRPKTARPDGQVREQRCVREPCRHLDPDTRSDAASRLQTIKGHLEGLMRTLEDDEASCPDVLDRLGAVIGALGRVSDSVLRCHVRTHVAAARLGDADAVVEGLMEAIKYRP
ncbi:MAG TPA: metal-sensing transcriptional repressor [Trueperaceae bacterium]|jgi:DNA-binding FrmR family transcriptional regulator